MASDPERWVEDEEWIRCEFDSSAVKNWLQPPVGDTPHTSRPVPTSRQPAVFR
jgi:hypothetical protein